MNFVDTHCHIQEATNSLLGDKFMFEKWKKAGFSDPAELIKRAKDNGVTKLLCVGTTLGDSKLAVELVQSHENCWATIGIHPHESQHYVCDALTCFPAKPETLSSLLAHRGVEDSSTPSPYSRYGSVRASSSPSAASKHKHNVLLKEFAGLAKNPKVVAVGECGLDYYYENSPKKHQREIFEFQLELAQKHNLPLVFHIRDAFDDFLAILSHFEGVRGVVHSFSANKTTLDKCLNRGLYIGLNGIMTFTKDEAQLAAAKAVPLDKLLLETDAPFLTPVPHRGTICEPKHVRDTAEFLSNLRGESLEVLSSSTTHNAEQLFNLK